MPPPLLYADRNDFDIAELSIGFPPAIRVGRPAMTGLGPRELAFVAGRALALFRRERFMHWLFPEAIDLEDLFLAALVIGRPSLPLNQQVKQRVSDLSGAIARFLQPEEVTQLRAAFQRFVEQGGRTNLRHWALGAECTAARAGLLLANDLQVSVQMLERCKVVDLDELIDDLIVFTTSAAYAEL